MTLGPLGLLPILFAAPHPRRKSTMDWQKLKTLLNEPLVLLEKIVKKEVEGPRPQNVLHKLFVSAVLCGILLVAHCSCIHPCRKDVLPEHLHAFILQLASPAEMDAEKAKDSVATLTLQD